MLEPNGLHVRLHQVEPIPLNATLSCAEGELLALVGPSGSGKTTILRSIAGLYRPAAGRVTCGDVVWFDTSISLNVPTYRRRAGLVFQNYALFPHMSALRNVTTALGHLPAGQREGKARALLSQVHLQGLEDRRPAGLSGGEQQRVAVARALARDPGVLLLDEPFSAVDRRTRRKLHGELAELRKAVRIPIVLVTHDLDEAASLCDRLCVLDRGETLQIGPAADVLENPASARVRDALDIDKR